MKDLETIKKEISKMAITDIINELAVYRQCAEMMERIVITAEQFDTHFRIKGIVNKMTDIKAGAPVQLETRGRAPKVENEECA